MFSTYPAFVVAGLVMLWRAARRPQMVWSGPRFMGALIGYALESRGRRRLAGGAAA